MSQLVKRRCKSVLGFEPELIRDSIENERKDQKLNFITKKLQKTVSFSEGYSNEIDGLLNFCWKNYK